jgi:putative glutamine amidotransferase
LIIGVTSADDPTPDNYVVALTRSGISARVIVSRHEELEILLAGLSGLLVTGGTDIDPARYGAESRHESTDVADHDRDAFELAAVRYATQVGLPLLMICRGMQIANVAFGGTLHQHLPDIIDGKVLHRDLERKFAVFPEHWVNVEKDSRLAEIVGMTRFMTNASHHQAVAKVGVDLRVVARTDDEIIEALEMPSAKAFWLATQWHPERLLDADEGRSQAIFQAFIAAAKNYVPAVAESPPS